MTENNPIPPVLIKQDIKRFWSKVDKTPGYGPWGDCWQWQGHGGYGVLSISLGRRGHQRRLLAHRIAFFLHTGNWPGLLNVLHRCDNPPCVNPDHLWLGTKGDNNRDAARKGRSAKGQRNGKYTHPELAPTGERHGMARRSNDHIKAVKRLLEQRVTGVEIARRLTDELGVSITVSLVSKIKRGHIWKAIQP